MIKDVGKILARLGLKESEIMVYLSCFQHEEGLSVAQITRLANIKRSTVNLIIERLAQKGFITFHIEGNHKVFFAEAPEVILFNMEDSLSELRSIIPLLKTMGGQDKTTSIRFFEGIQEVEKLFSDQILTMKMNKNPNKEILAISSGKDVFEIFPNHQNKFINKRVKERIPIRWIAPESELSKDMVKNSKEQFRQIKFFDNKKYPFKIEIDIYANKISLNNLNKNPIGVIIENKDLSGSFRSLFNLLWDLHK